jgi:hypothetical protein
MAAVTVTMKCPDALYQARDELDNEADRKRFDRIADRFFQYGEYLTVQIDTEQGTCTVVG